MEMKEREVIKKEDYKQLLFLITVFFLKLIYSFYSEYFSVQIKILL